MLKHLAKLSSYSSSSKVSLSNSSFPCPCWISSLYCRPCRCSPACVALHCFEEAKSTSSHFFIVLWMLSCYSAIDLCGFLYKPLVSAGFILVGWVSFSSVENCMHTSMSLWEKAVGVPNQQQRWQLVWLVRKLCFALLRWRQLRKFVSLWSVWCFKYSVSSMKE